MRLRSTFPRFLLPALGVLAGFAFIPGQAGAQTTATVTGDDGNPVQLQQGVPLAMRNMDPHVGLAFSDRGRFSLSVAGPDGGAAATPISCYSKFSTTRSVSYRGNGNYTVILDNFAQDDTSCVSPISRETYVFSISGGVGLAQPAKPFLRRQRNSYSSRTLELGVGLNPGASRYELRYSRNAVIGPDGAISGPSDTAYISSSTGTASILFSKPGVYTAVARASSGIGGFYTPWSVPIKVVVKDPFDLSTVSFPDSRGPVYKLKGTLRSDVLRGRVSIAIAPRKRGKFRRLGRAKIRRGGVFYKRFRQRRPGTYRLRFHYRGSKLGAKGAVVTKIKIRRRLAF